MPEYMLPGPRSLQANDKAHQCGPTLRVRAKYNQCSAVDGILPKLDAADRACSGQQRGQAGHNCGALAGLPCVPVLYHAAALRVAAPACQQLHRHLCPLGGLHHCSQRYSLPYCWHHPQVAVVMHLLTLQGVLEGEGTDQKPPL